MAKILIVEDEKAINDLVKFNLELVGHECMQVFDGKTGLDTALNHKYDLIIPYANLINSTTELTQYTNEIIANKVYDIHRSTAKIPSYREMYESYDGSWFENNSLIILVVESDSEILPEIASITVVPDEQIEVHIKKSSLGEKDNQVYTIFIETNKIKADIINITSD